jgi:hypothetical protein
MYEQVDYIWKHLIQQGWGGRSPLGRNHKSVKSNAISQYYDETRRIIVNTFNKEIKHKEEIVKEFLMIHVDRMPG